MNGLEYLYHLLFVEVDKGLWGIIGIGIFFAVISIYMIMVMMKIGINNNVWRV